MDDAAKKKLILIATCLIFFTIWFKGRPHSFTSNRTGKTLVYHVHKLNAGFGDNPPLVIALHGSGDRPDNFVETLFKDMPLPIRIIAVQGPATYSFGYGWPRSGPEAKAWNDTLADAVTEFTHHYEPPSKPVLVGFSTGGFMAYAQAALYPDLYSAIIPISGGLDTSLFRDSLPENTQIPILALHGEKDDLISVGLGQSACRALEDAGRNVQLTLLPGGHLSAFLEGHKTFVETLDQAVKGY